MTGIPGVDHPEEQAEAEIALTARGISVSSRVEQVDDDVVVVRPSVGGYAGGEVVRPGDVVEVFWRTTDDQRILPAVVESAGSDPVARWRLRATGPAEQSQRRQAVRARVTLGIEVGQGSYEYTGETVDLSEGGMRAQLEGFGLVPEAGTRLDVAVTLDDGELRTRAEVVRAQDRGTRWLLSIRFLDLAERDGDRVRRRVFQALREERARAVD
jgi:PilZ domain